MVKLFIATRRIGNKFGSYINCPPPASTVIAPVCKVLSYSNVLLHLPIWEQYLDMEGSSLI